MERHLFWKLVLIIKLLSTLSILGSLELSALSNDESSDLTPEESKKGPKREPKFKIKRKQTPEDKLENESKVEAVPPIEELLISPLTREEEQAIMAQTMPLLVNGHVERQLEYLTVTKRKFLLRALKRAEPYITEMKEIMKKEGLPEELAYLPLIESGFNYYAVSPKGAAGMWQFMPQTANWIGLKVNSWVDERNDPITSCLYAAKFLKYLYNEFGDWYIALASYNYGGRNMKRAMKKAGSRDYYTIVEKGVIPAETRYYVPRFIASVIIIKNLEKYKLNFNEEEINYSYYTLPFMSPVSLVSRYAKISHKEFMKFNPSLRAGYVPHPNYSYRIRLPEENYNTLMSNIEELKKNSYDNYTIYYVRSGDNLSTIAERAGVSLGIIMSLNNITNSNRIWEGQKLYLPVVSRTVNKKQNNSAHNNKSEIIYYTVKKGETLSHIALKFGISADTIIKLNQLRNPSFIKEGERIKVYK